MIALRNKFDALREKTETHTPNDENENSVDAHLETAAKYIPTKHTHTHTHIYQHIYDLQANRL